MSSNQKAKIICVVGARPNFMKIAPIMRAFADPKYRLDAVLLNTGQHYDATMKANLFEQLRIPEPDIDLGVGSGTHAVQTAEVIRRFEPVLDEQKPAAVLVVGDVNSTISTALVAVKKNIPVIHVESGLRSGDRSMPEEINRVLTDQISDLLFITERSAEGNLNREGIPSEKVRFVGNVMIDTLLYNRDRAASLKDILARTDGRFTADDLADGFGLLTLHRPSNVDDPIVLERLVKALCQISSELPLIFPVHPRTKQKLESSGLDVKLKESQIATLPPAGYLEMLGLMGSARVVLTDSGGIQEETTALGVPCITMRENTERPITVEEGTNTVVGTDPEAILTSFHDVMKSGGKVGRIPEYWDGKSAERIAASIREWLDSSA